MPERFDPKNKKRKLRTGEYYVKSKDQYRYKYKDADGSMREVWSYTLTANDKIPQGCPQKSGESLREKEAEIQKRIAEGLNNSKGNMSLYDLMCMYIKIRSKDVKETTKTGYRTQKNFMKNEAFGKKKIQDITESEAILWFDELHEKQGKGYSTLQTLRGILRPAYTMAKKNRWVDHNPFDFPLLKKRYGGVKSREALSRRDMRRFLDFVRQDAHFRVYFDGFFILFNTGLRISEFCGLTLEDIDLQRHTISVNKQLLRGMVNGKNTYYIEDTTKTEAGARLVPMTNDVEECFRNIMYHRPKKANDIKIQTLDKLRTVSGFLFLDKNGNPEVAQHWENHFRWAVDKFNRIYKEELPPVTPHIARHTFCSNMASAGMSPKTLQTIMGHSSIAVTMDIYTHLSVQNTADEMRNIINNRQYEMYSLKKQPTMYVPDEPEEPEWYIDEVDLLDFNESDVIEYGDEEEEE